MHKITEFKTWILETYKTEWHTLCDSVLWEAKGLYKQETGIYIPKFWD